MANSKNLYEHLEYLYALGSRGIKPGLERIQKILQRIGNPQYSFGSIHIAGTNGKGSTCAIIASILQEAGYKVGLYTSPHLVSFNERIRVNGEKIDNDYIIEFISNLRSFIDDVGATFFEVTTAMAFNYFKERGVDFAVVETGLGGRYDATNVIKSTISVITTVGKDHEAQLGKDICKIASEKVGITKEGVPCVVAKQQAKVKRAIQEELTSRKVPFYYAPDICKITPIDKSIRGQYINIRVFDKEIYSLFFPLVGDHQLINLQNAVSALSIFDGTIILEKDLREGIKKTFWPGRFQIIKESPLVIYDVGHNMNGISEVSKTVKDLLPKQIIDIVISLGSKKRINNIGNILKPFIGTVYVSEIPGYDSASPKRIAELIRKKDSKKSIVVERNFEKILKRAIDNLDSNTALLILGSHYIAPVLNKFFNLNI
jgi:dihydrofolate synthase/folylpolyglutamate synthase